MFSVLYNELPKYNDKRRGSVSLATLRNLQRSRSNPQLLASGLVSISPLPSAGTCHAPGGFGSAAPGLVSAPRVRSSLLGSYLDRWAWFALKFLTYLFSHHSRYPSLPYFFTASLKCTHLTNPSHSLWPSGLSPWTMTHTRSSVLIVFSWFFVITFRMSHRWCKMYSGHARLCVYVCVSVPCRIPVLLHRSRYITWGMVRVPPSCALLGGFAIDTRVLLLWQERATHIGNRCTWQHSGEHKMLYACFFLFVVLCGRSLIFSVRAELFLSCRYRRFEGSWN